MVKVINELVTIAVRGADGKEECAARENQFPAIDQEMRYMTIYASL